MINNDTTATDTATAMRAAIARRNANTPIFIPNDRPADRSRNGRRIPRSVSHRGMR